MPAVPLILLIAAACFAPQDSTAEVQLPEDPRYGLLTPLPDRGGVPMIVDLLGAPTEQELQQRAQAREYRRQIRRIRHEHFGDMRNESIRQEGLALLREFTDPAAFRPLIEELSKEQDDVRLALLDHLTAQGEEGQAALAWVFITDEDEAIAHEAMRRMTAPASRPVLRVLDTALRSTRHETANRAGMLAGSLGAVETIPLLIFAQATSDPVPEQKGDIAWIAIQTQQAYVANLVPVVGEGSAAFAPVLGKVSDGVVLRVMDAVVVVYRTEIHRSLVNLSTLDWGRSTDHLGYDMKAWWTWYNEQYLPHRNERALQERLESRGTAGIRTP